MAPTEEMLVREASLPNTEPSINLRVEADPSTPSPSVNSRIGARALQVGVGLACLALIGFSGWALLPLSVHAEASSRLHHRAVALSSSDDAFAPSVPVPAARQGGHKPALRPQAGVGRPLLPSRGFAPRRAELPGGLQQRQRKQSCAVMSAEEVDMASFLDAVNRREADERMAELNAGPAMTGDELKQIVISKWGHPYDARLSCRRGVFGEQTMFFQVMWKHLREQSFPMSAKEYDAQLDAVASYITEWGLSDYLRKQIKETTARPGLTQGTEAKTVIINLNLTEKQIKGFMDPK